MKATRDWFGEVLATLGGVHEDVVVVNCDLGLATRTDLFRELYPHRFFECGIAEANAIGVAAGLAQEGLRPFVVSFGHFLTGKFLEIFQSVALNDAGVVLVGSHAGLAIGKDGPTQMGLRDLALMRTLPGLEILHPIDGAETQRMLEYLVAGTRPSYLRLCRQPQREVHDLGYQFRFGYPDILCQGQDIVVFSMGGIAQVVLDVAADLSDRKIGVTVVNVSSLPVDAKAVRQLASDHPMAYVVEDHFMVGGLADEIGRILLQMERPPRFASWGVCDYGQAAPPEELYARYRLDRASLAEAILSHSLSQGSPVG